MQSSVLRKADVQFQLELHPSRLDNVQRGVTDELNRLIMRYIEDLDGVVLSISEPNILSHKAKIHTYFPYFSVKAQASVLLFNPKPGDFLVGKVNQTGADYIGLLVLGVFSASIGVQSMRPEFKRDDQAGCWLSTKRDDHVIKVDSLVRFQVDSVSDQGGFFSMVGSLQDPSTGEVHQAHKVLMKQLRKDKKSSKGASESQPKAQKAKKRSRSGSHGESTNAVPPVIDDLVTPNKRKKKKSKAEQHQPGAPPSNGTLPSPHISQPLTAGTEQKTPAPAAPLQNTTTPSTSMKKRKRSKEVDKAAPLATPSHVASASKADATPTVHHADGVPNGSSKKKSKSKSKSIGVSDANAANGDGVGRAHSAEATPSKAVSGQATPGVGQVKTLKVDQKDESNGDGSLASEKKKKKSKSRSKDGSAVGDLNGPATKTVDVGAGVMTKGGDSVDVKPAKRSKKKEQKAA